MEQTLQAFVKNGTAIHKQRTERLEEANHVIKFQIKQLENHIKQTQKNRIDLNKELDQTIQNLQVVNQIQSNIAFSQKSLVDINKILDRIQKKVEQYKKKK